MFTADQVLGAHRWPLVRLGAKSRTEVILLSDRFFTLTTHWNNGTIPCPGQDCQVCELLPSRGLYYLAVWCASRINLLELGAHSAVALDQHCGLMHGGLRPGLVVELRREGAKHPVRSEVLREVDQTKTVSELELAKRTMAIYKFPPPNPGEELGGYERRCRALAKIRTDRVADGLRRRSEVQR